MKKFLASLAAMLLMAGAGTSRAQDEEQQPQEPQSAENSQASADSQTSTDAQPGAARISYVNGDVSTQRGDNAEWVAVTVNTPVVPGDRVATGQNASAELQLDFADILRMSASATAKVATLTRTNIQIQVGQGLVTYSVAKGSEATTEIDTPNVAIHPVGEGEYRILVNSDAETQVIVRKGSAEFSTPQGSTRVDSGQMITIAGTDNPQYQTASAPARDDWDRWNDQRDHKITSAESWKNTDRYYTGTEDLDSSGVWTEVPDYGRVWVPRQDPGWAPYRDGRWVYEPYYGWTWVSYEPWGWAPYHYGRWFVYGGNWAWWPGPVAVYPAYYPVWAPAYVSFFGFGGGGWGVGFGFGWGWGHVGWLPIGPCDWYHPWYGRWGGRVNVVSITNIHNTTINNYHNGFGPLTNGGRHPYSNINEALTNSRVRGGLSSMPSNQFGRGAVPTHQEAFSGASFRQASMVTGKMSIAPTRESYSPTNRAVNASSIRNVPPSSQHFFTPSRTNTATNMQGARQGMNAEPRSSMSPKTQSVTSFNKPANSVSSARPGWKTFTPPSSSTMNRPGSGGGAPANNNAPRSAFTPPNGGRNQQGQTGNQGGWQHYTPSSHTSQSSAPNRTFTPPPGAQRQSIASRGNNPSSSYRPPLNMRQPIVTPRNSPSSSNSAPRGGSSGGGYHSAPSSSHASSGGGSHGGGGSPSGGGHRH
jgi:uncharacterized membrane protein YgcG